MDNPFTQYSVGRSIGLSVLGAACFTVISIVVWPFVALAMWATPEKDGFGKWEDRKNFNLNNIKGASLPESTEIIAKVIIILEECGLKYLEDAAGYRFCFVKDTPGINFAEVQKGQTYRCTVGPSTVVLSATLIKENYVSEDELKESDFNTPTDEEMGEMMKNPKFAEYINSMQSSLPKAEPWPPEPGTWNRSRNKE